MFISHLPAEVARGGGGEGGYFWHIFSLLETSVKARNGTELSGKPRDDCPRHGMMQSEMQEAALSPFTQGLGLACRTWGMSLCLKTLGIKSSMD